MKKTNFDIINQPIKGEVNKSTMEEDVKIIIGKDDEDKFDEIREYYLELIQDLISNEDFGEIADHANQIVEFERLFSFVRDYCHDEKLVFCEVCYWYELDNIDDLQKKRDAYYTKLRKHILRDM